MSSFVAGNSSALSDDSSALAENSDALTENSSNFAGFSGVCRELGRIYGKLEQLRRKLESSIAKTTLYNV
ncbi:hypothetical protein NCCP2331_15660 [Sporosarcina sp. NCCP-2331]|nr:hypothetical protein NCCP2331_15660 [Sporosarcina sp. NCCP-2331]GLB55537.1 hypothetical protein NCCP2378_13240 [Sporosarcina sp. NCCP-2378]